MDLSSLFGEREWTEFLEAYRRKETVLKPDMKDARFADLWATWELDALYRFTLLPESDTFRLFTRGKQVPGAAYRDKTGASKISIIQQLWSSGVSINCARMELFSNPILMFTRSLEAAIHCPVRAHFFATPAQAQALGVHADHDDVLVVQLRGEKSWDVYADSARWSVETGEIPREALRLPKTVTLKAGGWLYLPKGVYHEVRNTAAEPSTHITFGLHSLSWAALLSRAAEIARQSPSVLSETVTVAETLENKGSEVADRLLALRPFVDVALRSEQYGQPIPVDAFPVRAKVDSIAPESWCRWRVHDVKVRALGNQVELALAYRTVPLALRVEYESTVADMKKRDAFRPIDLPLERDVAVLFCQFLANVGCLSLN